MEDHDGPIVWTPPLLPPAAGDCLVRIQQILLANGYVYVGGDENSWPLGPVQMSKEEASVLISPWAAEVAGAVEELRGRIARGGSWPALLLVGSAPTDDPRLEPVFADRRRTVAYLDAQRGRYRLAGRRGLLGSTTDRPLRKRHLREFLSPAIKAKAAGIDAHARLAEDLSEARRTIEFVTQANLRAGAGGISPIKAVLVACVALFVAMVLASGSARTLLLPSRRTLLAWGASYGPLIRAGQWWRMLTCGFVHVGLIHLLFNMLALYVFGAQLELLQGRWRLAVFFLFSVVAGSAASVWWRPLIVSAGASGGIFGLVGAMGAVILRHRRDFPRRMWRDMGKGLLILLLYNAAFAARLLHVLDHAAHLGGLAGGLAIGLVLSRSPIRRGRLGAAAVAGTLLLTAALAAGAWHAVSRVPADAPLDPESGHEVTDETDESLRRLKVAVSLVGLRVELDARQGLVNQAWDVGRGAASAPAAARSAAAERLRRELLPRLAEPLWHDLDELARVLPKDLASPGPEVRTFLAAAGAYCRAVADALEGQEMDVILDQRRSQVSAAWEAAEARLASIEKWAEGRCRPGRYRKNAPR